MEITYIPEPGKRWIPYYLDKKPLPRGVRKKIWGSPADDPLSYETLVRCPCCGSTHLIERPVPDTWFGEGNINITCKACNKTIGVLHSWYYYSDSVPGIWTDDEQNNYRIYQTTKRLEDTKKDFEEFTETTLFSSSPSSPSSVSATIRTPKIHRTRSGKYTVIDII